MLIIMETLLDNELSLMLVLKSFHKDKEETVSFHVAVKNWSIDYQSCSQSLVLILESTYLRLWHLGL